jgi:F-type H+-transporting ATPase subunit c
MFLSWKKPKKIKLPDYFNIQAIITKEDFFFMEAEALKFFIACVTAAGFGIAIAAFGCGIGQGLGLKAAVEGIARNPEASGKVTVTMLIGLAMIESLCIYALVISLILIYATPMAETVTKLLGH